MGGIRIVTDSTADLPPKIAEEQNIHVIPLNVHFGDKVYRDGVDLNTEEFFDRLEKSEVLPKTSQPSAGDFVEFYHGVADKGDTIISIHISSEISGTVQSAQVAAGMLDEYQIEIIDSRSVSLGLGMLALRAARAAEAGQDSEDIISDIQSALSGLLLYFTVDTLEYLHRGGRLSTAEKLVGSLLNIRPVITMEDGKFTVADKMRGKKRSLRRILEHLKEDIGDKEADYAICHGRVPREADFLEERLRETLPVSRVLSAPIGPVVGTHSGPGAVGIFALKN